MLFRFCLYGFLKNQRYFEPFFMLALLSKQLSFFEIGFLYACRWLTLNLLEIPSGVLADAWGRRRCMMVSFVAYIVSFLCFALADETVVLVIAMIMFGVGDSFRTGTHKAMIFHWLRLQGRENERTRIYGLTRSWSKIGSAVSTLLAAGFLLLTRDYQTVFLFAAAPCLLNMINLWGYPKVLDLQPQAVAQKPNNTDAAESVAARLKASMDGFASVLKRAFMAVHRRPGLRGSLFESVAWEGVFHAVKDYLQPVLLLLGLALVSRGEVNNADLSRAIADQTQADPATIICVAVVYFILYLLSAQASRTAHRLVTWAGSADAAALPIWVLTATLYLAILMGGLTGLEIVLVLAFASLIILQNVWRPILIGRIDQHSQAEQAATILSIESQMQRIATMCLAPAIGFAVDWSAQNGQLPTTAWWPIGALGLLVSASVLSAKAFHRPRFSRP